MRRLLSPLTSAFLTTAGTRSQSTLTVRDALRSALDEEMARDEKVFMLGEEVGNYQGAYKVSKGLVEKYGPHRLIDTPITEHGFTGMAVGAAHSGLRPIVEFMTFNFALQAIDQIVNSAAKGLYMSGGQLTCPIVFRGPNGASAGVGAQHSQCLAPWLASVPGLKVVSPYDIEDARGLLKSAIRDDNPVAVLEHELLYGESFPITPENNFMLDPNFTIPFGKSKIMRAGKDITLIGFSRGVGLALAAADILAREDGVQAEVLNLRSLRPLDRHGILQSIQKTHRAITIDESFPICNIGAEIMAMVMESDAFDALDAPMERISCADCPTPYSKDLERASQPQVEDVLAAARRALA